MEVEAQDGGKTRFVGVNVSSEGQGYLCVLITAVPSESRIVPGP